MNRWHGIVFLAVSVLIAGSMAPAACRACTDWTEASPISPSPAWDGAGFLGTPYGDLGTGFLLKKVTSYSGGEFHEYALYDITDPMAPVPVWNWSGYDEGGWADLEDADGVRCILGVGGAGGYARRVWTLTGGGVLTAFMPRHGEAALVGDYAFQICDGNWEDPGIALVDLSVPNSPAIVGEFLGSDFFNVPFAVNETQVLAVTTGGTRLVDFVDPANPVERGFTSVAPGKWLGRVGDLVIVSNLGGTYAIDVSDPDGLPTAWTLTGQAAAFATRGTHIVFGFTGPAPHLQVYDMSGGTPVAVGPTFGTAVGTSLDWSDDFLVTGAMEAWDMSDVASPAYLGNVAAPEGEAYVAGEYVVTAAGPAAIHCSTSAAIDIPGAAAVVVAAPNPFNPATQISYGIDRAGSVDLRIMDARGALVRTLFTGSRDIGHYSERWDGRDDSGRAVAAGVYFVRLTAPSGQWTTKVTLVE